MLNPFTAFLLGGGVIHFVENEKARAMLFKQIQTLSGMAIDGLNKQGGNNVPKPEPPQQPEA